MRKYTEDEAQAIWHDELLGINVRKCVNEDCHCLTASHDGLCNLCRIKEKARQIVNQKKLTKRPMKKCPFSKTTKYE